MRPEDHLLQDWRASALRIEQEVAKAIIGQHDTVRMINVALFARGHVLLEGDVGIGKTTILRAFARAVGGDFERVEGTVDLMPGDLVYHTYVDAQGKPRIDPGPLLRRGEQLTTFFFNEINRARPQVQSLLLRAMAERSVAAFDREYRFPHMTVFADRNKVSAGRSLRARPLPGPCSLAESRRGSQVKGGAIAPAHRASVGALEV